jgi:hypothetical protein
MINSIVINASREQITHIEIRVLKEHGDLIRPSIVALLIRK